MNFTAADLAWPAANVNKRLIAWHSSARPFHLVEFVAYYNLRVLSHPFFEFPSPLSLNLLHGIPYRCKFIFWHPPNCSHYVTKIQYLNCNIVHNFVSRQLLCLIYETQKSWFQISVSLWTYFAKSSILELTYVGGSLERNRSFTQWFVSSVKWTPSFKSWFWIGITTNSPKEEDAVLSLITHLLSYQHAPHITLWYVYYLSL